MNQNTTNTNSPETQGTTAYKLIDWSYSGSTNAQRLGFKEGCWSLSICRKSTTHPDTWVTEEAITGSATKQDVITAGNGLPMPWWPPTLRHHPEITPGTVEHLIAAKQRMHDAAQAVPRKLTVGEQYDTSALQFAGWTDNSSLDGACPEELTVGYQVEAYFRSGEYLGQDGDGIEPLFTSADPLSALEDPLQWLACLIDQRAPIATPESEELYRISLTGAELARIRSLIQA